MNTTVPPSMYAAPPPAPSPFVMVRPLTTTVPLLILIPRFVEPPSRVTVAPVSARMVISLSITSMASALAEAVYVPASSTSSSPALAPSYAAWSVPTPAATVVCASWRVALLRVTVGMSRRGAKVVVPSLSGAMSFGPGIPASTHASMHAIVSQPQYNPATRLHTVAQKSVCSLARSRSQLILDSDPAARAYR